MKIRKGDQVRILAGKDRGAEGTVSAAFPETGKVIIEGYNVARRHTKGRSAEEPGGIIDKDMPMDASNVAVLSPKDGKPTRIGYSMDGDTKIRVCKRTGEKIPEAD